MLIASRLLSSYTLAPVPAKPVHKAVAIVVDERGGLRVDDLRGAAAIGLRQGRYRLIPVAADVLLLRRAAAEGAADEERVFLAGELEAGSSMAEILNLIYTQRWDGALTLLHEGATRSVHFQTGNVRAAASTREGERLESVLYRFGFASREQIAAAPAEAGAQRSVGRDLVERGVLSGHDLYTAIRVQAEEIVHAMIVATDGIFVFRRQTLARTQAPLNLDTQSLLMEGVRRLDEMKYFRGKIASTQLVLEPSDQTAPTDLEEKEARVLALIDGQRTLDLVARQSRLGEFETTKYAFHLLEAGFVRIAATPAASEPASGPAASPAAEAEPSLGRLIDAYNPYFKRIFRAAAGKGREAALRSDVESFFRGSTGLAALFRGVEIGMDGTLARDRLLANLATVRAPRKTEFLHQALSEFLYFVLFSAMEELDRQGEQELERRVQEILRDSPREA